MSISVGIVGYGYWGTNLVRNFSNARGARLVAVADRRDAARDSIERLYPGVATCCEFTDLLCRDDIDALVIATPLSTHYEFAARALDHGKHVLVEKPLCQSTAEGRDLVARAEASGRVLMVDHTFLFTGAVQAMAALIARGELGKICYFDSTRVNLGLFQPDTNCLWDLAPHDLSIIDHLVQGREVVDVEATGYCHLDPMRPDMVFMTAHFADDLIAHLNMSWMSPVKVRRFMIGGTRKMLMWDDLDQDLKVKVYDHGVELQPEEQRNSIIPEYRIGDIYAPQLSRREALAGVVQHFIDVIEGRASSIMDGGKGIRVVSLLERAQRELDRSLSRVAKQRSAVVGASA